MYGLGIAKGLAVTFRNLFRKPFTVQYPEEAVPQAARFRGEEFGWFNMGSTVILLFQKEKISWLSDIKREHPVEVGKLLANKIARA